MNRLLLTLCLLLAPLSALAVIETYEFSEPGLEERYHALSQELRCPKCQNQNIADSNAPIAQDLRKILYQQLEKGASDQEILEYMVARYGEFVRYRPRFDGAGVLLWLFPLILLVCGGLVLMLNLRKGRDTEAPGDEILSEQQKAQLDALLEGRENNT